MAVLDTDDTPGGKTGTVADAVNLIDDRDFWIASAHEITVQRMHVPRGIDGALRRDEGLADHLTAEDALPADLRAATSKQVVFKRLKVEYGQKLFHGV